MEANERVDAANGTSSVLRPAALFAFSEQRALRTYQRSLPHWRQEGCTYFVTFRLGDSIPSSVRRKWEYEQAVWLRARGIDYDGPRGHWRSELERLPLRERFQFEKHFNQKVQACLDRGLGECWLRQRPCARALKEEILRADGDTHHVGDFVIMPNHVHLLTTPIARHELELILKINKLVGRSGSLSSEIFNSCCSIDSTLPAIRNKPELRLRTRRSTRPTGPTNGLRRTELVPSDFPP